MPRVWALHPGIISMIFDPDEISRKPVRSCFLFALSCKNFTSVIESMQDVHNL